MMSSAYRIALATLAAFALAAMSVSADAAAPRAVAARRASVTDTAYLQRTSAEGSIVFEHGRAYGAIPGYMHARLDTNVPFRASFTLEAHGGRLRGHGSATLCEQKCSGPNESFHGWLVIDGGTGRYAHARGRGGLYGVYNRETYGVTVQTTGTLSY